MLRILSKNNKLINNSIIVKVLSHNKASSNYLTNSQRNFITTLPTHSLDKITNKYSLYTKNNIPKNSLNFFNNTFTNQNNLKQKKMVSTIPAPTVPSLLNWSYTPSQLNELTEKLIADGKKVEKQIESIPDDQCSFETVIVPIGRLMENEDEIISSNIDFFQHVSMDKDLRDASAKGSLALQEYEIERSMNKKLYEKVAKVTENIKAGKCKAPETAEDKRLLEKLELDFRRDGLALPDDKLAELKELKKKLTNLGIDFSRNIAEGNNIIINKYIHTHTYLTPPLNLNIYMN